MADWQKLAEDFIREFDVQVYLKNDGRKENGHTNLANSQYVVSLHRDSKGQILHLHINANRIDMEGNTNNSYMIRKRAMAAANKIHLASRTHGSNCIRTRVYTPRRLLRKVCGLSPVLLLL